MISRRSFISTAGVAGANLAVQPTTVLGSPTVTPTSRPRADHVHVAHAKLIHEHINKLMNDPTHDIFASGALITSFRAHWEALEADGTNAAITQAVRSGGLQPIHHADFESHFAILEQWTGRSIPTLHKQAVAKQLIDGDEALRQSLVEGLTQEPISKL